MRIFTCRSPSRARCFSISGHFGERPLMKKYLHAFAIAATASLSPLPFLGAAVSPPPIDTTKPAPAATLPDEEKHAGFRLLFDGTPTGWRQLGGKEFPAG